MKLKYLIALPFACLSLTSQAQTLAEAVQACSQTDNSLKRLVCYDRVAKDMRQYDRTDVPLVRAPSQPHPAAPQAGQVQTPQPPMASQDPVDKFGMEHKAYTEGGADKILVSIQDKSKDRYGKWTLTLSNGQIWKQDDSQNYYFPDGQVYIERGLFGAFYLGTEESNRRMRVERLK
ncbi:hypothetical protein [Bowmanella dokdonensis]|uniref:Lipoprotein n=1 Tax=Bowmanella dokdonensis TaxID=751969 RepID=A0A939DJL0_9ALTE|nr:hypothetical protein [Bowmanella dokdonensis]MBN7823730.1 hypothetical protein [Bowmanella dokdonensis]